MNISEPPAFFIDPEYLCSVSVKKVHTNLEDHENPTINDISLILKDESWVNFSHSVQDHPEFAKLRNRLEQEGFIRCNRGWWNGDEVIEHFTLNHVLFKPGDKFLCGTAMKYHLSYQMKINS